MENTIYQELWNIDEHRFTVSGRGSDGGWADETADILLDEQVKAQGGRQDRADRPLFFRVNEAKLNNDVYQTFLQLLNNFVVNTRQPEEDTLQEQTEIEEFLDAIMPTKPMKRAFTYITDTLGEQLTEAQFRTAVKTMWFEYYTNFHSAPVNFCTGFEHVFVGEGKYDVRSGRQLGEISGYHSWVKFYFDEHFERNVNFLGHFYELQGGAGPGNLKAVTLRMIWNHTDLFGNVVYQLYKNKGGFFVGISPACEFALGTVAFYEHLHQIFAQDRRRVIIDGITFDLVIYREKTETGRFGNHIRSFYPEVIKTNNLPPVPEGNTGVRPIGETLRNSGPIVVISALPNPSGADKGNEWVELQNISGSTIDLTGWVMTDKQNRPESLSGMLEANEKKQFKVTRANPGMMQLGNGGGLIGVFDADGNNIATVSYQRAQEGQAISFNVS